ncbi:MAG: wax ester/triacylglycerol synthase family O-acyltransferase [Candidatus Nanopelagicales bacterium]
MADRLNSLDVSFLYLEESTTPMHVGSVAVFQPPDTGFDYDRLVHLIKGRIALVPRFRQRVRWVPGGLANPVWVDDESFDVTYHVRRSALPKPGTEAQLRDLVGRIMSRQLDRTRPLWEMYLIEGLEGGRFAILSKTHHAMIDGVSAVDIGQVILDVDPEPRVISSDEWRPTREPSRVELMAAAVGDLARSPANVVDNVRTGLSDVSRTATSVGRHMVGIAAAAITVARPTTSSPLNAEIGEQRRYGTAHAKLTDLKDIRRAHGGTVNDVVLAITAGALRAWLMTRGESVSNRSTIRAMVPVSVRSDETATGGNRVAAFLVDLPVGEADPVVRLQRISFDMAQHKESGQMLGAEAIVAIAGFAPPTLHSMGARLGSDLSKRVYNLVITNVPGPQFPLYAGGALMLAAYPVVPLAKGQAVSIGLTSYNGGVYFGLNADRDSMPDVDVLAQCLVDATDELKDRSKPTRRTVGHSPKAKPGAVQSTPAKRTRKSTAPKSTTRSTPSGRQTRAQRRPKA